jgi:hypothetical protein
MTTRLIALALLLTASEAAAQIEKKVWTTTRSDPGCSRRFPSTAISASSSPDATALRSLALEGQERAKRAVADVSATPPVSARGEGASPASPRSASRPRR